MATNRILRPLLAAAITIISLQPLAANAATPGTWDGTAEFGAFELDVGAAGTDIGKITFHFSDWTCGSVTMNGGIGITPFTPWPINGNMFSLTVSLDPDKEMTIAGTFESAANASGTWDATVNGTNCDGDWVAINGDAEVEIDLSVDHAFVEGVYWNPDELPGWGFFADQQEEILFGAVYGYLDGESTFITLAGTMTSSDPPVFEGDVFFVSNEGAAPSHVGSFTWNTGSFEASSAAMLTLSSNILNVTDLGLVRLSYAEIDHVDVITGGDWNIIRRSSNNTFGDLYTINDRRIQDGGITYAEVVDKGAGDKEGLVGYFPDDEEDFYGMLLEFDGMSNIFYVFLASNTDMYGRYWILDPDEDPTGGGEHFRAAADTFQADNMSLAKSRIASSSRLMPAAGPNRSTRQEMKALEILEYQNPGGRAEPMFEESRVLSVFSDLSQKFQQARKH